MKFAFDNSLIDFWDHPDVKEWLESAVHDMFPKMRESTLTISIWSGNADAKLAIEIGAAILFDKPLILMVTKDAQIPPRLERLASEVVRGDLSDATTKAKLMAAINRHLPRSA